MKIVCAICEQEDCQKAGNQHPEHLWNPDRLHDYVAAHGLGLITDAGV